MSAAKILILLAIVVAGEATVLPLIKAIFAKESYGDVDSSDYYTRDDCIYPSGYSYSGYNGYPNGYYGYNGYGSGYNTGYNSYPRRHYSGYAGYPRGYNGYTGYNGYNGYIEYNGYKGYPHGYYSGYSDIHLRAGTPRQGKTWSELCKVHYPDSSGAPGKAGVVCL